MSNLVVSLLPPISTGGGSAAYEVASEAEMLALPASIGDIAHRTDTDQTFILTAYPASVLANWLEISSGAPVSSVFGRTGAVVAVSGDYNTDLVTEGSNLYFTDPRALTAVGKTNNATGWSIAGGTTSKTLTLVDNAQIDQDLLSTSTISIMSANMTGYLTIEDAAEPPAPAQGFVMYANDAELGRPFAKLGDGTIIDMSGGVTENTTGFEITGGLSIEKTLTVSEDSTINQGLSTTDEVRHGKLNIRAATPEIRLEDSTDQDKHCLIQLDHVNKTTSILAEHTGTEPYHVRLNPGVSPARVSLGRPNNVAAPPCMLDLYGTGVSNDILFETALSGALNQYVAHKNLRYSSSTSGDRNDAMWWHGFTQTASPSASDRLFWGRVGISSDDMCLLRSGNVQVGTSVDQGKKLYVDGDVGVVDCLTIESTGAATESVGLAKIFKTARYSQTSGGNADNSAFEIGFTQSADAGGNPTAFDSMYIGRSGWSSTDLRYFRTGNFSLNSNVDTGDLLYINGSVRTDEYMRFDESPSIPFINDGFAIHANSGDLGKPYVETKIAESNLIDLINGGEVTSVSSNYKILQSDKMILVDTTSSDVTLNYNQNHLNNHTISVKKIAGANNVIIDPDSGLIEGSATLTISDINGVINFTCNGVNSYLIDTETHTGSSVVLPELTSAPPLPASGNVLFSWTPDGGLYTRGTYTNNGVPLDRVFSLDNTAGRTIVDNGAGTDIYLDRGDAVLIIDTSITAKTIRWNQLDMVYKRIVVKHVAGLNNITLAPDTGLIEGGATYVLNSIGKSIEFVVAAVSPTPVSYIIAEYN